MGATAPCCIISVIMGFKILLITIFVALVEAGFLEPVPATLKLSVSAPAPVVSLVSPPITKTVYTPGSYSSSYRSDVITPRVKYVETPGVSITVPQPSIAVAPALTHVHHIAPVVPAVTKIETVVPVLPVVAVQKIEKVIPVFPTVTKIEHVHSTPLIFAPAITKTVAIKSVPLVVGHAPLPLTHKLVSHSISHL